MRSVGKLYGSKVALRDVSCSIAPGQLLGILGPNGAGKSTLQRIISGRLPCDAGDVRLGGKKPSEGVVYRAKIGEAGQDVALYDPLLVRENLDFYGHLRGLRGSKLRREIGHLVEQLGIGGLWDRRAGELSTGERRKVHNAIAFLGTPALVILDEPTAGLDLHGRELLAAWCASWTASGGMICYSTHQFDELEEGASSILILSRGSVVAHGTYAELLARAGPSAISLRFDGPAPLLPLAYSMRREDTMLRVETDDITAGLVRTVSALGEASGQQLQSVVIERPDLEGLFRRVTHEEPSGSVGR